MRNRLTGHFPLAVAAVGLVLFACGSGGPAPDTGTVTILTSGDESVTGPYWDEPAKFLMFLPLVARNADGELEGRLARSWEHSPDYRQWTVHLRSDVRWHDGMPVTARDVAFTLELLGNPHMGYAVPSRVTVLDDSTYTLELDGPAGGTPLDEWTVYYPEHLLKDLDPEEFYQWEFWKRPVGNGPYRYVRHVPETMMELEANPDHYDGLPRIERVVLKFAEPALVELLSGNVDAVRLDPLELPKVAGDSRFRVHHSVSPDLLVSVLWNLRREMLSDSHVRRALTMAIDRQSLHRALGLPGDMPVFDGLPTIEQFRRGEFPEATPYDSASAARLLDQAGWRDSDGDGVRERAGTPLRFTLLVSPEEGYERTAVFLQAQLRQVGADAQIQRLDRALQFERVRGGDFDATVLRVILNLDYVLRPGTLLGEGSYLGYADPEAMALVRALDEAVSPEEVDRIHDRLGTLLRRDLPFTVLYPEVGYTAVGRRLEGMKSPWRADPVWYLDEYGLADEE